MSESAKHSLKLFYWYAHEDKALRDTLDRHLSIFKHQRLIEVWYDREIIPGTEWENEIDKHLGTADIVLLLVSADFLASDYCYGKEMTRALQRHGEGTSIRAMPSESFSGMRRLFSPMTRRFGSTPIMQQMSTTIRALSS